MPARSAGIEQSGEPVAVVDSWLQGELLESLADVNEQCLQLLREQAVASGPERAAPPLHALRELWLALDEAAVRRAATCPYLLLDAGFGDARRWAWGWSHRIHDGDRAAEPFFTVPATCGVLRLVLTFAWHLTRSRRAAARLLLGMSVECAQQLGTCTLRQLWEVAERHPEWLQPRWPGRLHVWRELLLAAVADDPEALERSRVRGLQLLAGEARAALASVMPG